MPNKPLITELPRPRAKGSMFPPPPVGVFKDEGSLVLKLSDQEGKPVKVLPPLHELILF
jgi:hypothetical protein